MMHIPRSGPLRLDGRSLSSAQAVERVRNLVRRLRRPRARVVEVVVDHPSVTRALVIWAIARAAHWSVEDDVVSIFLLPADFGEPPAATMQEVERLRVPWPSERTPTPVAPSRVSAPA